MTPEAKFKQDLTKELKRRFPGCEIFKGNSAVRQGVPDWIILFQDRWAMLEVKAATTAKRQPNQAHYVAEFGEMSFAAFIYPENAKEVLDDLQRSFESPRPAFVPER
jgi:hypothetical protein